MPFKSERQRKFLWMHEPAVAQEFADAEKSEEHKRKRAMDALREKAGQSHSAK